MRKFCRPHRRERADKLPFAEAFRPRTLLRRVANRDPLPPSGFNNTSNLNPKERFMKKLLVAFLAAALAPAGADAACCYFSAKNADILQPAQKVFINWDPVKQ